MLKPKYFIVEAEAPPEIFPEGGGGQARLERARRQPSTRRPAAPESAAAHFISIGCGAAFNDMMNGRIVTFQTVLRMSRACCPPS